LKSKRLAHWLQDHTPMLGSIDDEQDGPLHLALYEGIIDVALHGDTRMVDSILESSAAHAVAVGRTLTDLLDLPHGLRGRIWQRITEEIDPEPAFVMLSALDAIFMHVSRVMISAYLEATSLAVAAKSSEISRRYNESERKVMEYAAEVSRANRELARLEQAKTDFISIAAHELKTPLTLIQGYVNILREMKLEKEAHPFVAGIDRGARRMHTIIEDMLDLSAMDTQQLQLVYQKVKLKNSVNLVITHLQQAFAERNQTVETVDLDSLPEIEADPNRLYQIFRQLINNAIKYTPDGGHITITGQELAPAATKSLFVELVISDTGIGIAPEDKEKVFERFYRAGDSTLHSTGQTKFMGAGPGLGLAIVRGLVEAHGGKITVESPGYDLKNFPGSAFRVLLPVQASPQAGIDTEWLMPGQTDAAAPGQSLPIQPTDIEETHS